MKKLLIAVALGLALVGGASAQCTGGISRCPAAATANLTDLIPVSQLNPLSPGGTGYTTRAVTGAQLAALSSGGVTISGTPAAGYVPIATSATTAVWGNTLSALNVSNLQFPNNITYSGSYTLAQQSLTVNGIALFGTAGTPSGNGPISPFNIYVGGDAVDTTTNGNGNLDVLAVTHATNAGSTGGRTVIQATENVVGAPALINGSGYTALAGITRVSANMGGATGAYGNYKGPIFGGNSNAFATSGATFLTILNSWEFDSQLGTGSSAAEKHGFTIVLGGSDVVRATYDDAAIEIASGDNASAVGWKAGLMFGGYAHQWSFAADSTLIGAQVRQVGPASSSIALNGVDFSSVTFQGGGCAFKSTGFCIDPSGNGTTASSVIGAPTGGNKGANTINIAGTIWTNGTQGVASKTCTVNQALTLIFTNGILTGGTCNS